MFKIPLVSYAHRASQDLPLGLCLHLSLGKDFFKLSKLQNECIDAVAVLSVCYKENNMFWVSEVTFLAERKYSLWFI